MSDEILPEADRLEGAPHPRETAALFGQQAAEDALLEAIESGRMHHAWLLTGPKGVGKATLAWRAARFLLARPVGGQNPLFGDASFVSDLSVAGDHPVSRRIAAMSEPGLLPIRRPWDADKKRFKTQITVDEVRKLNSFFGLSATDGGFRVVIVDSADEMNTAAANALLKVLEEPPRNAVLFLVSHRPARLLPTIRSRCRELRLSSLEPEPLAQALAQAGMTIEASAELAELSGGSVGEALRLSALDGVGLYTSIVELLSSAPRMDRQKATALAEHAAQRGAEDRLDLTIRMIDKALARLARTGAGHVVDHDVADGETEVLSRLSPNLSKAQAWAELNQVLGQRMAHGRAVNIDPASLVLDALLQINETAGQS
ncbi:DNA polymerase III subunit delta' [Silicimonas sp. MF1-12-2]|uniref:DNA polymerase III subunit delta' n=1 Tax=Silicimonas sp. MF1-12-2 TaxID=3384793 RepID=UPI0039B4B0FC